MVPTDERAQDVTAGGTDSAPAESLKAPPDGSVDLTANQLVAYNVQRARRARGWQQDEFGAKLEAFTGRLWSKASVSAAESSWRAGRLRRFDANELLAFSEIFGLPVSYFFLPPDEAEYDAAVFLAGVRGAATELDGVTLLGILPLTREALLAAVQSSSRPAEYVDRLARERKRMGDEPDTRTLIRLRMDKDEIVSLVEDLRAAGLEDTEIDQHLE